MAKTCGIDPGFSGGIAIITEKESYVFEMPIVVTEKKQKGKIKKKKKYDLQGIRDIFEKYLDDDSAFFLEEVHAMPHEGTVSSFNFGRGLGNLEGLIMGYFGKKPNLVRPTTWKKTFKEKIETEDFLKLKQEIKEKKQKFKQELIDFEEEYKETLTAKEFKKEEKQLKKENKKVIDKMNRQVKNIAKDNARFLAGDLFPSLKDKFKTKNKDGLAESLLIAMHGKEFLNSKE